MFKNKQASFNVIFMIAVLGLLFGIWLFVMATSGINVNHKSQILRYSVPIKSMQIEMGNTGSYSRSFMVGYGFIDTDAYYFVYENDGNNQYILRKYNAEETYLIETDEPPRVEMEIKYFYLKDGNLTGLVDGDRYGALKYTSSPDNMYCQTVAKEVGLRPGYDLYVSLHPKAKLYVPKDTVKVEYNTSIN